MTSEPEVDDARPPIRLQQQVLWLEVAVNNPATPHLINSVGNVPGQPSELVTVHSPLLDDGVQRHAGNEGCSDYGKLVPIDRDRSRPEQLNNGRTDEVLQYVDLPVNSLLQLAREVDLY